MWYIAAVAVTVVVVAAVAAGDDADESACAGAVAVPGAYDDHGDAVTAVVVVAVWYVDGISTRSSREHE